MTAAIDVRRLLRIVTVLACIVAACLVYFAFNPEVDAATLRIDAAELQLNSDRTTAYNVRALGQERDVLSRQYAKLFGQNPEAVFIRGLAADVARHGVTLVSTSESKSETSPATPVTSGPTATNDRSTAIDAERTTINVSLRGEYRNLLATVGEMSLGPEIVRVDSPTLTRDRASITAIVPVTIFAPSVRATQTEQTR